MTFDELIAQGIRETLEEECAEYQTDGKKHHFSLAYKIARQGAIISARKRAPLSIRRIKYILLAILFTVFALLGFGLWRHFSGFSFNIFKDHSKVYISNENFKTKIEETYGLPEEYELLSIEINGYSVRTTYNVDGNTVRLRQYVSSKALYENTEKEDAEHITIKSNDGYYINMIEFSNLNWIMDGYHFTLSGKIDKNKTILLAESLKIRNFDVIP